MFCVLLLCVCWRPTPTATRNPQNSAMFNRICWGESRGGVPRRKNIARFDVRCFCAPRGGDRLPRWPASLGVGEGVAAHRNGGKARGAVHWASKYGTEQRPRLRHRVWQQPWSRPQDPTARSPGIRRASRRKNAKSHNKNRKNNRSVKPSETKENAETIERL